MMKSCLILYSFLFSRIRQIGVFGMDLDIEQIIVEKILNDSCLQYAEKYKIGLTPYMIR